MPQPDSTYSAALDYLLGRIDYEKTTQIPYKQGEFRLDRMRQLLARLGNPHEKYKIVHITGTKGKGSTSAMIAAMLTAAGNNTGLYTSPHLERIEERIRFNGKPCEAAEFVALLEEIKPHVAALDDKADRQQPPRSGPTFFELTTAMAMLYFAKRKVQFAVLEVGLGGRLDSTNIVTPLVSVITNISFDHTKQLGRTLDAIAAEKGGIIKPNVPVISGVLPAEPRRVIEQIAERLGSNLRQIGRDFDYSYSPATNSVGANSSQTAGYFDYKNHVAPNSEGYVQLQLGLLGRHQAANAAIAVAAINELQSKGIAISEQAIRQGLRELCWLARIEIVSQQPLVIIDAAHNEASITALLETIRENFKVRRKWLIFAGTKDKPTTTMLRQLWPFFDGIVLTRYFNNPRAFPVDQLQRVAQRVGDEQAGVSNKWHRSWVKPHRVKTRKSPLIQTAEKPADAWRIASQWAEPGDLICITGSFFLTAEIRSEIST